jgi:hypothetical protein
MKMKALIISLAIAALAAVSAPALANEGMGGMGGPGTGMPDHASMERHRAMSQEMLGMFKDVMVILKDLNHKPSPDQTQRLDAMIKRMDEIIKEHEAMKKGMDTKSK